MNKLFSIIFSLLFIFSIGCSDDTLVNNGNMNPTPKFYADVTVVYHRLLVYTFNSELKPGDLHQTQNLNNFDSVTVNINFHWTRPTNDSLFWQIDYAGYNVIIPTDSSTNYQYSFNDRVDSPISFGFYSINNLNK